MVEQPCGLEDASLRGAIKLYKALSKRLADKTLTKAERRRLIDQRRCLVEVFGSDVRLDPDTLKMPRWEPKSRSMSVPAPAPGALLVLVGEAGRSNRTFFIPFDAFARGERKKNVRFVQNRIAYAHVEPGDFDREVDMDLLAKALVDLANTLGKDTYTKKIEPRR